MEKDDQIYGASGTAYTTYFRENDTRIGRWWSLDPKAVQMPWLSPYMSMDGNPILYMDPLGDKVKYGRGDTDRKTKQRIRQQVKFRAKNDERFREELRGQRRDKENTSTYTDQAERVTDAGGNKIDITHTSVWDPQTVQTSSNRFTVAWDITKAPLPSPIQIDCSTSACTASDEPIGARRLDELATWLAVNPDRSVNITGYASFEGKLFTDDGTRTYHYNNGEAAAQKRASNVRNFLLSHPLIRLKQTSTFSRISKGVEGGHYGVFKEGSALPSFDGVRITIR